MAVTRHTELLRIELHVLECRSPTHDDALDVVALHVVLDDAHRFHEAGHPVLFGDVSEVDNGVLSVSPPAGVGVVAPETGAPRPVWPPSRFVGSR